MVVIRVDCVDVVMQVGRLQGHGVGNGVGVGAMARVLQHWQVVRIGGGRERCAGNGRRSKWM